MQPELLGNENEGYFTKCFLNEALAPHAAAGVISSAVNLSSLADVMQEIWTKNIPGVNELNGAGSVASCAYTAKRINVLNTLLEGYEAIVERHGDHLDLIKSIKKGSAGSKYSYLHENWDDHRENFRGVSWVPQDYLDWYSDKNKSLKLFSDGVKYIEKLINKQKRIYKKMCGK